MTSPVPPIGTQVSRLAAQSPDAPAVTCEGRGHWDPYELRRESVDPLDGRVLFALKSRGVFWKVRDSFAGRAMRALARPVRHRGRPAS